MKDVLEKIKARFTQATVPVLVGNIEKYQNLSDLHAVKNMYTLSILLYALGDSDSALRLAESVSNIDLRLYRRIKGFTDSAASAASYKDHALALCTAIYRESGDDEKADEYWRRYKVRVLETDKFGNHSEERKRIGQKKWKRNLEQGDLIILYGKDRKSYMDRGVVDRAMRETCDLLYMVLWMIEAGGSQAYPVELLTELKSEYVQYIRENLDAVNPKKFVR